MPSLQEAKEVAAQLPLVEQEELLDWLTGSIEKLSQHGDQKIHPAWIELAEDRLRRYEAGGIEAIPAEEVHRSNTEENGSSDDSKVERAWIEEVKLRREELLSGKSDLIDSEDVFDMMVEKHGL